MWLKAVSVLSTASILACASVTEAQVVPGTPPVPSRFSFGGDGVLSQPKGEFAANVGRGWGFNLNGMYHLDYKGFLSIRADAGTIQYARERKDASFFGITGRIPLDLETTNNIAWGAIGPQLMIPNGPFRPYVNAAIAYTDFSTTSTLSDPNGQFQSISNQNAHDGSHAWIFGSGFQIPVGTTGAVNFGAKYYYGGRATYLTKGDITDNPDGSITINPRSSKTDMVIWQVGFQLAIPGSSAH
jgi:hypothetical protein